MRITGCVLRNFRYLFHFIHNKLDYWKTIIFCPVPCLSVMTLDPHTERRTSFGNKNSYGRIRQQTSSCGRSHRLGRHPSVLAAAAILLPSSWLVPCTFQTVDAVFCRKEKGFSKLVFWWSKKITIYFIIRIYRMRLKEYKF